MQAREHRAWAGVRGGPAQTHLVLFVTGYLPLWLYGFITAIAILLVGSVILLIVCMTWRLSGKEQPALPPFFPA